MSMSGWCPAPSACWATRLTKAMAWRKSGKVQKRTSFPSSRAHSGISWRSWWISASDRVSLLDCMGHLQDLLACLVAEARKPARERRRQVKKILCRAAYWRNRAAHCERRGAIDGEGGGWDALDLATEVEPFTFG